MNECEICKVTGGDHLTGCENGEIYFYAVIEFEQYEGYNTPYAIFDCVEKAIECAKGMNTDLDAQVFKMPLNKTPKEFTEQVW